MLEFLGFLVVLDVVASGGPADEGQVDAPFSITPRIRPELDRFAVSTKFQDLNYLWDGTNLFIQLISINVALPGQGKFIIFSHIRAAVHKS